MTSQRRIMKILVIFILVVFLLSSWLVSVMYFVSPDKNTTAEDATGAVITGQVDTWSEVVDLSDIGNSGK